MEIQHQPTARSIYIAPLLSPQKAARSVLLRLRTACGVKFLLRLYRRAVANSVPLAGTQRGAFRVVTHATNALPFFSHFVTRINSLCFKGSNFLVRVQKRKRREHAPPTRCKRRQKAAVALAAVQLPSSVDPVGALTFTWAPVLVTRGSGGHRLPRPWPRAGPGGDVRTWTCVPSQGGAAV